MNNNQSNNEQNQENIDKSKNVNTNSNDDMEFLEPIKEVVINENVTNNSRYVLLAIFFVCLFAVVFFLPDITNLLASFKSNKTDDKVITTGRLICTLDDVSNDFDYKYTNEFSFIDSNFKQLANTLLIKGDAIKDAEALDLFNNNCLALASVSKTLEGVSVSCETKDNQVVQIQKFNYEKLNPTDITSAYVEAGGVLPTYSLNTDITKIEKEMNAEGYTCKRVAK